MKKQPINKHNLAVLLSSFTVKELKKLSRFLSSEYFSYSPSVKKLLELLVKFHPSFTQPSCTDEKLYAKIYPGKKFNAAAFRDLMSSLLKASVEFIASEGAKNDPAVFNIITTELLKRGSSELGKKKILQAEKDLENLHGIDPEFFLLKFRLEGKQHNYTNTYDKFTSTKTILKQAEEVRRVNTYIIIFTLLEVVCNYMNLIVNCEKFGAAFPENFLEKALEDYGIEKMFRIVKGKSDYDFIIEIYSALIKAFTNRGDWESYISYKELVVKNLSRLSRDEVTFHYSRFIACCILGSKYGNSRSSFDIELLGLYETFLEKRYYLDSKTFAIPSGLYRAIIFHALRMDKTDWLYKVITENEKNLEAGDKDNMQIFAYAYYYYATGNYGASLKAISKLKINYFIFKYDIYNLKLRVYYENGDLEPALELIHSYRQYLRNDPIMPKQRKGFHRAFILYMEKLIRISLGSTRYDAGFLIKQLKSSGAVHKKWLIDKLKVFEKATGKYKRTG